MSVAPVGPALGEVFPPRTAMEIEHYDHNEVARGWASFAKGDIPPGPNRSPGYRWGWQNQFRDHHRSDDSYDHLRHELMRLRREHHGNPAQSIIPHPRADWSAIWAEVDA